MEVYLNSSDQLKAEVKRSMQDQSRLRKIPLKLSVRAKLGSPLEIEACDGTNKLSLETETPLEAAQKQPLSFESIKEIFSKLGRSIYTLESLEGEIEGKLFLNQKELKDLKNKMIKGMDEHRTKKFKPKFNHNFTLKKDNKPHFKETKPKLTLLLRKAEQLTYLLSNTTDFDFIDKIILDFEFGKDYFESVNQAKEKGIKIGIATTRILKPGEYHNFRLIERCEPDGILIRNLGALNYFKNSSFAL